MNIVAVIQARMGSSRLPCKALLYMHGLPLIDWVVHRLGKSRLLHSLVVAIPDAPLDDVLAFHLENQGVPVFRGPEQDVLKRFSLAAGHCEATHGIRGCADNPLIWGGEIDNLIRHYLEQKTDAGLYAYNHMPKDNAYPDGLGAEMVSAEVLHTLDRKACLPAHREHCLSYIWDNPQEFRISTFDPPDPRLHHPEMRLDVDTADDFRKLSLMAIHPDMAPPELLLRYPRQ